MYQVETEFGPQWPRDLSTISRGWEMDRERSVLLSVLVPVSWTRVPRVSDHPS